MDHFFSNRGPLSQQRPFLFKFAVHYLRNGPEDFGSDDIYEVPRPQHFNSRLFNKYRVD